ncbi:MAG: sigma-54 dependent transcriptional regulator [Brevinematales bacterium]|nr:sigma-54 dependent transcriptional regulator [Brevinematales bacterium]
MARETILIIDDEEQVREGLKTIFELEGYNVITSTDGTDGIRKINTEKVDLIILDLKMPNMNGYEFLKTVSNTDPYLPVIILTAYGSVEEAVNLTKQGAFDYFIKPPDIDKLLVSIGKALDIRKSLIEKNKQKPFLPKDFLDAIIGESEDIKQIKDLIRRVASTDATVLITGESGTGKELVANAIHALSPRREGPFVKVNCGSIPETLLEAELFGHEKGAFTGAINRRKGRFELANGGTIFLDEIGEISPKLQVALLRVLQEKEFQRVGGEEDIKVDVRIIAATNKNLEEEVKKGSFREDLFYRINTINIHITPLRQRKVDIPILSNYFLKLYSNIYKKSINSISKELMDILLEYPWYGNVRELQNFIESSVIICNKDHLSVDCIPLHYKTKLLPPKVSNPVKITEKTQYTIDDKKPILVIELGNKLDDIEKKVIEETLKLVNGNKSRASRILGITRKTLLSKMDKYGLDRRNNSL